MRVRCDVCQRPEKEASPYGFDSPFVVSMHGCDVCGDSHPVCSRCAADLRILDMNYYGPPRLSACPDAAQVARELMEDE